MIRKEGRFDLLKIVIMAFLVLSSINGASAKEKDTTWKSLQKEFSNPSKEYRSAPLWVWNSKVTHSEIDRMLLELHEAGFGGILSEIRLFVAIGHAIGTNEINP